MWGNNKTTRWTVLLIVAIIMMMGYVFWDIVVFSAVIGVLSCSLMGWIENGVSPLKRIERKSKKKKEAV